MELEALTGRHIAAIAAGGLVLTALCLALIAMVARTQRQGSWLTPDLSVDNGRESRFFFEKGRLIDLPEAWVRLLHDGETGTDDWTRLRRLLSPRFAGIPDSAEFPGGEAHMELRARDPADDAVLHLSSLGGSSKVTLREAALPRLSDVHLARLAQADADAHRELVEQAAVPLWRMTTADNLCQTNAAFAEIEEVGDPMLLPRALAEALQDDARAETIQRRVRIPVREEGERWFEVTGRKGKDGDWLCTALEVTMLVNSEIAQRSFVQTLAKTFAQLSTGLAIFDRTGQLILFNPALLDLTMLPPEFLSARPSLTSFFDELRNRQIMPEPKSYSNWRDQIADLANAAADDRYQEMWSLPSGLTYRVTGRPHPNGATAFLFQNISSEVTMTRQFREQVILSRSILDAIAHPVVVFGGCGDLGYCNAAYRSLWGIDEADDPDELTAAKSAQRWQQRCTTPEIVDKLLARMMGLGPRAPWAARLELSDGKEIEARFLRLKGGAIMIGFVDNPSDFGRESILLGTEA